VEEEGDVNSKINGPEFSAHDCGWFVRSSRAACHSQALPPN
jgi:hypothetical protein